MNMRSEITYKDAGVDIDFVTSRLSEVDQSRARKAQVIKSENDFAGLFSIKELCAKYENPILVSGTDGVGTKLLAALTCENFDGLGQDLVAMCVNDIATKGAEPLFFLDYFATSNLKQVPFVKLINGIVTACEEVNCALIGGETAELPNIYEKKHFDLAGFAVGIVDRKNMLGAHLVNEGDVLLGIPSSGLHSNGFSLVRRVMFDKLNHRPNDVLWQDERGIITVADELCCPTKLYPPLITALLRNGVKVNAVAHITGGGIKENVPRILPPNLSANIDLQNFNVPKIFQYLMDKGPINAEEMCKTFNMGMGLIMALPHRELQSATEVIKQCGERAVVVGQVKKHEGGSRCQIKI